VAERKIWFGNLLSSINNHLTLGYVRQPSARRAAKPRLMNFVDCNSQTARRFPVHRVNLEVNTD
jgi:hypothetical protein